MKTEVRQLIRQSGLCAPAVTQLEDMLPDDDLDLDKWIEEAIREKDQMGFHLLAFAALSRGRPVDERHLATAATLSSGVYLASIALRVQGEMMPEYLLAGLVDCAVQNSTHALALLSILVWCDERRKGVYPDQLLPQARILARRCPGIVELDAYLVEIAARTEDKTLERLVREHDPKLGSDLVWQTVAVLSRKAAQTVIGMARGPLSELLAEPVYLGRTATTIQRAVPRIGRNEPCPCGSGKKYKHCCSENDAKRLRHSSDVAGLTQRELAAVPELHLTRQRLEQQSGPETLGMEVSLVPRHLLTPYFFRLSILDLDRAAANLEKLGYCDDLDECWKDTMFNALRLRRPDIGERLLALRQPFGLKEEELPLSFRLLLAQGQPGKWLGLVEEASRNALKTENAEDLVDVASAVAFSDAGALGMLLFRGVLPFIPAKMCKQPYELQVLPTRERLNLPVNDPLKILLDNHNVDAYIPGDDEAKLEEDLLLPQEAETDHPFRLIEFPRNFRERLNGFPHHVGHSAMAILGRLCGGDSAAFNGSRRLKGLPNVLRQRVGIDFRLLFRLLPDRIEVIDLIPRQDLERKIKTIK